VETATRQYLVDDHAALLRLFERVLALFEEDDRDATRRAWSMFERGLVRHMEAEEALIFPAFREVDAVETGALADDHARFRAKLDELGVAVDLHAIRADVARQFVLELEAHSRREDEWMYRWAETHLDPETRRSLHDQLRPSPEPA